jgi:hypothetical protein
VNQASASVADPAQRPSELMRLVAGGLTMNGFDVRPLGRGLLLVEALSNDWGLYTTRQRETTKVAWAEPRESGAAMSSTPMGGLQIAGGKPCRD